MYKRQGQGFAVKDSITLDDVKIGENAEAESVVIYDSKVGADEMCIRDR